MSLDISSIVVSGASSATVCATLSNIGLVTGFYWREIGIFATDPQLGEILFGYDNSTGHEIYVPPASTSSFTAPLNVGVYISNAANVTATIDPSLVFATSAQVNAAQTAAATYTDTKVGAVTVASIGAETPAGAQAKANTAETNAKTVTERYVGDSINLDTALANLDDSEYYKSMSRFVQWNSGTDASTYVVDSTGFTLVRSGIGYVKGKKITWTAGQKSIPISAKTTVWVYMDSTGTIGITTSAVGLYTNNVVLFYCWFDGTNYFVQKENHNYSFTSALATYLHQTINVIVRGSGILIDKVGSGTGSSADDRKLLTTGADYLDDHGLSTSVTATNPLTLMVVNTDATGKWVRYVNQAELPSYYNNAGTPTALNATPSSFVVYTIYGLQDSIQTGAPRFMAVMDTTAYSSLVLAQGAITSGSVSYTTNEIKTIEPCQLGYAIVTYSATGGYIAEVVIARNTFNQALVGGGAGSASNHAFLSNLDFASSGHTGFETPTGSQAKADAVQTNLTTHLADYVRNPAYGPATGLVNAYTFSAMVATALVDGMSVYLDNVIAANTGASTFNWSGLGSKAIVDSKGNALIAGKMPLNCIIGLRYNASTTNFQLLGEGGGGTALVGDLLSGKTATVDSGLITGTMPNKVGSATVYTVSTADQPIAQGYTDGVAGSVKVKGESNLVAAKIIAPNVIGSVTGTAISLVSAGSGIIVGQNATRYTNNTTSPVKLGSRFTISQLGSIRISFELDDGGMPTRIGYGQVYKNGVAVGILRSVDGIGPIPGTTFTEDFNCNAGDYFDIYAWNGSAGGYVGGIQNVVVSVSISICTVT